MEDVEVGELVLTYNEITKCNEYKPVEVKHERYTQQMLTLELPTGELVSVTPEHRFYCNDQWVTASELRAGGLLHLMDGNIRLLLV
ncbi:Hint domain-containing protein [Myroides sp. DF42-4-2]|uniref:Hint domain-containing protein n=1 Tax=Myroides sp. DF42-4-2 TaxID=2746726 RepID=UPI0025790BA5|nr:Hint domain-containing protein [Myroides sp. DF42-4-2]